MYMPVNTSLFFYYISRNFWIELKIFFFMKFSYKPTLSLKDN